jgi:hypothetical protein
MIRVVTGLIFLTLIVPGTGVCTAQSGSAIAVSNVSTDRTPTVLVSWSNTTLDLWQEVRIERSMADSVWEALRTVIFPAESMLDNTVESRGTYRYRAVRLMADTSEQMEWGDTVTVLPDVAVDLLDYLIPNPTVELNYRFVSYTQAHHFARETTVRYRPMDPVIRSDHEHAFPFRKIIDSSSGSSDTALCEFRCLYDSVPRVEVDDMTMDGWRALNWLTIVGWPQLDEERTVRIGEKEILPWRGQRFIENDSVWQTPDREILHIFVHYRNTVQDEGVASRLKRDIGVQWIYHGTDGVGTPVHDRDSLMLLSVTSTRSPVTASSFELNPIWPHPIHSTASIAVDLSQPSVLQLSVYDALGRKIAVLVDGLYDTGHHMVNFDASGLPRGLYFIRAVVGSETRTQKVVLR